MKKAMLVLFVICASAAIVAAQVGTINNTADILGAHLGYGRGCVMCHAPHSGPAGNNKATNDTQAGEFALWGQDLTPLYGDVINFSGDGKTTYQVTLPKQGTLTSAHDANTVILFCLSCHDGNLAKVGMMKGVTVETLPVVGGNAPTLLGADGTGSTNMYQNDHPVGANAVVGCQGAYQWDCTGGVTTAITMNGTASAQFLKNYPGSFWNATSAGFGTFGTTVTAVTCTTCHDQHSMTVFTTGSGTTAQNFATSFFIRGNYQPQSGGNNAAQFCRNCHGGEANEMHGVTGVSTN
ncbi:MAG TPA: hypothetical protein VMH04_16065 [Candidatus Solibacter sp.]|nr:hypothetical protein [Candidatus Solibacter sp.]